MRLFFSIFIIFLINSETYAASLKWEVVHPFRFYRFASDFLPHELAHADVTKRKIPTDIVMKMEAKLNDLDWWETKLTKLTHLPKFKRRNWENKTPIELMREARKKEIIRTRSGQSTRAVTWFKPKLGWSSSLRISGQRMAAATCWDEVRQSFSNCVSEVGAIGGGTQYVHPKQHIVRIWIEADDAGDECSIEITDKNTVGAGILYLKSQPDTSPAALRGTGLTLKWAFDNCDTPIHALVKIDEPLAVDYVVNGISKSTKPIIVKDIAIASMGDSFSSGEGNPDFPAQLDPEQTISLAFNKNGKRLPKHSVPRRAANANGTFKTGASAKWIDRRCHRSMYSSHARTSIALALHGNRHHAVTFVSVACSGAEITDGIFWAQDGRECTYGARERDLQNIRRHYEPQIGAMVGAFSGTDTNRSKFKRFQFNALDSKRGLNPNDHYRNSHLKRTNVINGSNNSKDGCSNWPGKNHIHARPELRTAKLKRNIDLLLLSIGGNDMGFAPLVTKLVLNAGARFKLFEDEVIGIFQRAAGGIDVGEAKRRIERLDERFNLLKQGIKVKLDFKSNKQSLKDVLITQYPTSVFDERGRGRNHFCYPEKDGSAEGANISSLFRIAGPNFPNNDITNLKTADGTVNELNDKIAKLENTFTVVSNHLELFEHHGICAKKREKERTPRYFANLYDMPQKDENGDWTPFHPVEDFYPYVSRQRWWRTLNDSYLLMFYFKGNAILKKNFRKFYLAFRTLGGPMHPTAEGHAAYADAIFDKALERLYLKGIKL